MWDGMGRDGGRWESGKDWKLGLDADGCLLGMKGDTDDVDDEWTFDLSQLNRLDDRILNSQCSSW